MTCFRGQFRPIMFTCTPSPCNLPTDIPHAAAVPCNGTNEQDNFAWRLASGANCTTHCQHPSRHIASTTTMSCFRGVLSPPTFECREPRMCVSRGMTGTELTSSGNSTESSACWEGRVNISHGNACHSVCNPGSSPSVAVRECEDGEFFPRTVNCVSNAVLGSEARCMSPLASSIANARTRPCWGDSLSYGLDEMCEPQCLEGYAPNVHNLTCKSGGFDPPTFACHASTTGSDST